MRRCGVVLLTTMLSTLARADDSALLAGLAPPGPGADYPAQLVLPATWLAPLEQLAAASLNSPNEVAQCVYLLPPDNAPTDLRDAIDQYGHAIILHEKGGRATARALAAALAAAGAEPVLSLGEKQKGEETSVGSTCVGTSPGTIHTHPQTVIHGVTELLSDVDAANFIVKGRPMAGVVSGNRMCIALSRQDTTASSDIVARVGFGAAIMVSGSGSWTTENTSAGLARLIGQNGGALYCGPIGPSLPRVLASTATDTGNILLLEAKAWVMAMRLVRQPDWPAPDFPFTPTADPAFLRYLQHVLSPPAVQALRQWQQRHGDSAALLRLVATDAGAAGDALWNNGFILPDPRRRPSVPPYFAFFCDLQRCGLEHAHVDKVQNNTGGQLVEEYWTGGVLRENAGAFTTSLSSAQQALLEAKSALLATRWSAHPEWPLVNFDFTPELDEPFWTYLKQIWPQQQLNELAGVRASGDAPALSRLIRKTFATAPQAWGVLATVPDAGSATFNFSCSGDFCSLAPLNKAAYFAGAAMPASRASYSARGASLFDAKGGRIMYSDGSTYVGGYRMQGHGAIKSGRGRLTTHSYTLDGMFANDELAGSGKILMPGSAVWHAVTVQNNVLQVDPHPVEAPVAGNE